MNELNERLYNNYIGEIKKHLEFLKTKGYVLIVDFGTTNLRVNKYSATGNNFIPMYELFEFPAVILEDLKNYYEFDVNNTIINLSREILPELSHENIRDYFSYLNWSEKIYDSKKLKKEFNELKKINKNLEVSKIDKSLYTMPQIQSEALVKEFIVYVDSKGMDKGYYQQDKASNKFKKLNDKSIISILENYFDVSGVFTSLNILQNMKKVYLHQVVQSDLPIRWNEHIKATNLMKDHEQAYQEVKKVTDNFM